MSDKTTITFYVDDDGAVWAASKDDRGPYAVRQTENQDDFAYIVRNQRIQRRGELADIYVTDPEDLVAKPFAWLTFHHEDGSTFLLVEPDVATRHTGAGQFLFNHLIDAVAFVGRFD